MPLVSVHNIGNIKISARGASTVRILIRTHMRSIASTSHSGNNEMVSERSGMYLVFSQLLYTKSDFTDNGKALWRLCHTCLIH